ncbi:MAG TPA: lipoyl synthase [bacterium]|nr:lipoyl synthase [bacterium]
MATTLERDPQRLPPERRPEWLKVRLPGGPNYQELSGIMREQALHTVCEEARCPNIGDCWERRTATFLILGNVCTRNCSYCAIAHGMPSELDLAEPERLAHAVAAMGLRHAVITSVNRDELADGGAFIYAETIRKIREFAPSCTVEVLIPDFKGDAAALQTVLEAQPEILNHNIESVPRVFKVVRHGGNYMRSLELLRRAKEWGYTCFTKSGIILGMGETRDELLQTMDDLRTVDCDVLTMGQYLRPGPDYHPIDRYYTPEEFRGLKEEGLRRGFKYVESGPLVRSSYHADEQARAVLSYRASASSHAHVAAP